MIKHKALFLIFLLTSLFFSLISCFPLFQVSNNFDGILDEEYNNLELIQSLFGKGIIYIDDNWSDASSAGLCYGEGTQIDPYRIEGITIDASSNLTSCIYIENSNTDYFVVRNCTFLNTSIGNDVKNYHAGIKLVNSSRGTIYNNIFINTSNNGILLSSACKDVEIYDNIFLYDKTISKDDELHAIRIGQDCGYISVSNNTITNYLIGIGIYSDPFDISIEDNTIEAVESGIYLRNTYNPVFISGNELTHGGISFLGDNASQYANHVIYPNNTLNGGNIYYLINQTSLQIDQGYTNAGQVILVNCNDCEIFELQASINVYHSNNNEIRDNIVQAYAHGIWIEQCNETTVSNNTINNCTYGLGIWKGERNELQKNNIFNNSIAGMFLYTNSLSNITDNIIQDNLFGVYNLILSNFNNISHNEILNNDIGLNEFLNFNNTIQENEIHNNRGCGINITSCFFTSVIENDISHNGPYGMMLFNSLNASIDNNNIILHDYSLYFYRSNSSVVSNNIFRYYVANRTEIESKWNLFIGNTYNLISENRGEPPSNDLWGELILASAIVASVSTAGAVPIYLFRKRKRNKPLKGFKQKIPAQSLAIFEDNKKVIDIFDDQAKGINPSAVEAAELTMYTAEFLREIDQFGFNAEERAEFLQDMRLFTPRERNEIVENIKRRLEQASSKN
ncbi:MAG: right-handed parallel beta-helix repeat-containing protein [Candidatus Lokiarchaeota archaeon]|nr:right-handed parallel beta-helix repeat-containing protein [Candidatus Lokiarchaeota archaeon]